MVFLAWAQIVMLIIVLFTWITGIGDGKGPGAGMFMMALYCFIGIAYFVISLILAICVLLT